MQAGIIRWKARLKIFDITDESLAPDLPVIAIVDSSPESSPDNDFGASVVVDYFTESVGLFFYRQEGGDPCETTYRGRIRSSDSDEFVLTAALSGSFPSLRAPGVDGLGHYVAGATFNEPGRLLPSWSQPVNTMVECTKCDQDQNWSVAVFTAGVRP